MSYPQLGEASRYMHKSQGMGNDIPVEPRQVHLELIDSAVSAENPIFLQVFLIISQIGQKLFQKMTYVFNWKNYKRI